MTLRLVAVAFLLLLPAAANAQQGHAAPSLTPSRETSQFDFLVGQWELTVTPKVSGLAARIHGAPRLVGTWKAWRAFDGFGIEDEMRILDRSGNPASLAHSLRVYNAQEGRWSMTGLDVYRARYSTSTAEWRNGEIVATGRGTDNDGKAYVTRTRFFAISKDKFSFQQDRSADNGRTWEEGVLKIEAKRSAAVAPR